MEEKAKAASWFFASGNDSNSSVSFPSSDPLVLSVGASNSSGRRWKKSNYGDALDVVAPGENVQSISYKGYTCSGDGTSFACPHVAGIAALILSLHSDFKGYEVTNIISESCKKLSGYTFSNVSGHPLGTWNPEVGYGLVDATAAIKRAKLEILKKSKILAPEGIESSNAMHTAIISSDAIIKDIYWSTEGYPSLISLVSKPTTKGTPLVFSVNNAASATNKIKARLTDDVDNSLYISKEIALNSSKSTSFSGSISQHNNGANLNHNFMNETQIKILPNLSATIVFDKGDIYAWKYSSSSESMSYNESTYTLYVSSMPENSTNMITFANGDKRKTLTITTRPSYQ